MLFDLFIFDFDGTLVDSAAAKASAFYELFPVEAAAVVTAVLGEDPEGPRQRIIAEMLRRLRRPEADLELFVARYTALTDEAVGRAPEVPGASAILEGLRGIGKRVYVSSNTPEAPLKRLLERRGWLHVLDGVSGYPAQKADTARRLIETHGVEPTRTAVVGDGESDRRSAACAGAQYFAVRQAGDLQRLGALWGLRV